MLLKLTSIQAPERFFFPGEHFQTIFTLDLKKIKNQELFANFK